MPFPCSTDRIWRLPLLFFAAFLLTPPAIAQDTHALMGEVVNATDSEPLPGATVEMVEVERGVTTDEDGRFRLEHLEAGTYALRVRFVGFRPYSEEVSVPRDRPLTIQLEPSPIEVGDVVITASPVGETAYQSAQAFDAAELQELSGSSFGELLDGEPGIAMRSFGPAPARPVIRGFDDDRVLILENGERMGDLSETAHDHSIGLDPLAAERVEVVRGPASLLYGSSALGGVINIITRDLPRDWTSGSSGSFTLEGASMNNAISGMGRYQFGGDAWSGTARLSYRNAGDVRTPAGSLPGTSIGNLEGAAGVGYQDEGFEGGFSVSALDYNYGLPEEIDDPSEESEIRLNQQTVQGRGTWSTNRFFDQIELRFHGSRWFQQEVGTEFTPDGSIDGEDVLLDFLQGFGSATATLHHQPMGALDEGAVGLNVHVRSMDVGGEEAFTPGVESGTVALFTFQEIPLSDIARFQFGLRGEVQSLQTRINDDFPDVDEQRVSRALSGSVGVNVQPAPSLEIGAQVARAHRFPILEELFANGVHFGAGVFERGESSLGTEVGVGTDLFARWRTARIYVEVAGFYNRVSDLVAFEPTGEMFEDDQGGTWDVFEYRAGDAELLGSEAQVTIALTEVLQLGGVVDYVRGTRIDSGEPLPTMPPLRGRLTIRRDTDRWWLEGQTRLVNEQTRVAAHELSTDGYVLFNLHGGLQFDAAGVHRVSLRIDNLMNTLYRDHLSRVDRSEFGFPMPGRNVSLSYRYLF